MLYQYFIVSFHGEISIEKMFDSFSASLFIPVVNKIINFVKYKFTLFHRFIERNHDIKCTLFHGYKQKEAHLLHTTIQDKLTEMNQITNWHQKYWNICTYTIENRTRANALVDFYGTHEIFQ